MQLRPILKILGTLICFVGGMMVFPLLFSLYYRDGDFLPLLYSMSTSLIIGASLFFLFRGDIQEISHKEGFIIVTLGWVAAAFIGSLPYLFSGTFDLFLDAYFESTSGFTTTGATVLEKIEGLPKGILFWRSLTHWLGGMGIILLSIAILPLLGVGGMQLYKAEVPGPVADKIKPRIAETAKTLWKIYVLISVLEAVLLLIGGMDLFNALCHTFGTMATGGFSTMDRSIGAYNNTYFDIVITVFMLVAGANFALHYQFLKGNVKQFWESSEFKFYMAVFGISLLYITLNTYFHVYRNIFESLRYSSFQVASILTTTGYVTADFETWPYFSQIFLLFLMFIGGCAGSTGGSIKCMRIMLLLKQTSKSLKQFIHPHGVFPIKIGKQVVPSDVMNSVLSFFLLFIFLVIIGTLIMASLGMDIITAFAAVVACIGNIGPGLGSVGPMDNYSNIPYLGKWVLIFLMFVGRLEVYTIILLLVPEFWRK
ncbi:MAG: TrkH family potassium uptake protein [Thermodesulfobacteriota bacterium]|nr:TrkH family potassium uptake protein [Thermodesulfobacteriota bacterium]